MIAGALNRYITIEKETTTINAVGTPSEAYTKLKDCYATLKYTSGDTQYNEGEMPYTDVDFSIRHDSNVNYKCRVALSKQGSEIAPTLATPLWTLGAGWSYGTGTILKIIDGVGTVTPVSLSVVAGKSYLVEIDVTSISGSFAPWTFGGVAGITLIASGKVSQLITATTTGKLILTPLATGLRIVIKSISIKEMVNEYYKILNIEMIGRKDGMRLKCIKWDAV